MRRVRAVVALLALAACGGAACGGAGFGGAASAAELRVRLDGVAGGGSVRVGLFDGAEGFARRRDGVVASRSVRAAGDSVRVDFAGLAPGRYAVTAYHDANDNRRLDRVLGLVPREGVALSNDPPLWRAPGFEELAVEVRGETELVMRFVYPRGG